jgi:hypothetical protein
MQAFAGRGSQPFERRLHYGRSALDGDSKGRQRSAARVLED